MDFLSCQRNRRPADTVKPRFRNSPGFDLGTAVCLAKFSNIAYEEDEDLKRKVKKEWGFGDLHIVNATATSTQGLIAAKPGYVVVAFRGTEITEWLDWATNTDAFYSVEAPLDGRVHRGFWNALDEVWLEVRQVIQEFRKGPKPLWLTGHSLGGALATLATAQLLQSNDPVRGLYTFGQPRVGDRRFAQAFDSEFKARAFRFVNDNDIVPELPSWYAHVGTLKYFSDSGVLRDSPSWYDWTSKKIRRRSVASKVEHYLDHRMTSYYAKTIRACRQHE